MMKLIVPFSNRSKILKKKQKGKAKKGSMKERKIYSKMQLIWRRNSTMILGNIE